MNNTDRKDTILQAAIKVFSEKGYNAATTREIAEEAGVSIGTMFRHFRSKEDILYELPVEIIRNILPKLLVESMETIFTEYIGKSPEETLRAFINSRIKILSQNYGILKVVITESFYNEELREIVVHEIMCPVEKLIENFIKNGMESGYFKNVNPKTAASFIIGSLLLLNLENIYFKKGDVEQLKDEYIDLLFKGISSDN